MADPLPDLLRRAAAEMRRRTEAATQGPWITDGQEISVDLGGIEGEWIAETLDVGEGNRTEGNARHIASWHPGVAVQVADLLDTIADVLDQCYPGKTTLTADHLTEVDTAALAVAHEYLRQYPEPLVPAREAAEPGPAPVSTVEGTG